MESSSWSTSAYTAAAASSSVWPVVLDVGGEGGGEGALGEVEGASEALVGAAASGAYDDAADGGRVGVGSTAAAASHAMTHDTALQFASTEPQDFRFIAQHKFLKVRQLLPILIIEAKSP